MNTLTRDLLRELECPVCLRYFIPPIPLCSNGHSVCNSCRTKVRNCPTCRCAFINHRSLIFENIVRSLQFPCSNQSEGCAEVLSNDLINEHEAVCSFGPHPCPMNKFPGTKCNWEGKWKNFEQHMNSVHKADTIIKKQQHLSVSTQTTKAVLFVLGEIFLYYKLRKNDMWFFAVILAGTLKQASKFKSIFTLRAENRVDEVMKCQKVGCYSDDFNHVFETFDSFRIDDEEMDKFVSQDRLNLTVEVRTV
ncbi:E3 ubiquitin-protein ligase sina-like [Periplaneta americana]|uniref:E3 ubiquitin-protein ligase sina-like n=1 Tax=Periplaneta americana TaxID=6978 RepID=UPI0037E86136